MQRRRPRSASTLRSTGARCHPPPWSACRVSPRSSTPTLVRPAPTPRARRRWQRRRPDRPPPPSWRARSSRPTSCRSLAGFFARRWATLAIARQPPEKQRQPGQPARLLPGVQQPAGHPTACAGARRARSADHPPQAAARCPGVDISGRLQRQALCVRTPPGAGRAADHSGRAGELGQVPAGRGRHRGVHRAGFHRFRLAVRARPGRHPGLGHRLRCGGHLLRGRRGHRGAHRRGAALARQSAGGVRPRPQQARHAGDHACARPADAEIYAHRRRTAVGGGR
eukprot:ctg_747.g394